jgi:SAM-dependent methyltransferase
MTDTSELAGKALENHLGGLNAPNYRAYEFSLVAPHVGRSFLEVGAGLGEFASQFTGKSRMVLTDTDPICLDSLRERFGDRPDVEVRDLDLDKPFAVGEPVESVIAMNVLEHIDDDIGALRALSRCVVPGGTIVLWVPAYMQLYGDFDRKVGHVRRYTPSTLRTVVEAAGLRAEKCHPINFLGGLAWWAAVKMGGAGEPKPALVKTYDRVVVPITRALESRVRAPFGQTVLCVARTAGG